VAEVSAVAVIGAGVLGRGIAHLAAMSGYRTILENILPNALRKAEDEFRILLDHSIDLGLISAQAATAALARLQYAESVEEAAREADLVIEAVPDEFESKSEIFILLDKICRPSTLFACNTLTLSVSEIASVTYRAPSCVGMKFRSPVYPMKQLEIVQARETSSETVAAACAVGRRMGKEVVVVQEAAR
jgi:3-hydroxybutyryl-CoA dehydrogenase